MKNFDKIGEDLFNKIRGRFPGVTIGDEEGNVTNEPEQARFFDFDYKSGDRKLGKVSVSISEDNGLTVIFSRDFIKNEDELTQKAWYNFLRELRKFSKKRLLNFDVRDITKTNLTKRDYKFLAANRPGDETMNESKLYGTGRVSYQNIDSSRIVIKHNENIDQEIPAARTRNISSIYIESAEGERFKYPYRHLSGARAMARHVAEGGKPYDDFGSHITELSEEMWKLRKFKNYVGRSSVMAESLEGYMDIVKERVTTIKKTIENLQKPNYYRETVDSFEKPIFEEVPEDVKENWIDELTIRQFNEELKDVFPYIYRLVGEGTRAKALGPEDLLDEDAELVEFNIRTSKKFTFDGDYKNYDIYVSKQKDTRGYYMSYALRGDKEMQTLRGQGPNPQTALKMTKQKIDDTEAEAEKISSNATINLNVNFIKDELPQSTMTSEGDVFYAKLDKGPSLVVANEEWGDDARELGFSKVSYKQQKNAEGSFYGGVFGQPANVITQLDLIKFGRYVLGSSKRDSDGNYVFPMSFHSVAAAPNDSLKLGKPAVGVNPRRTNESEISVSEDDDPCWKNYKQVGMKKKGDKKVPNCVPKEEIELEQGFEEMMGQFSEATVEHGRLYVKFRAKNSLERDEKNDPVKYLTGFADFAQDPDQVKEKTALRKFTALNNMKDIANAIKKLMTDKVFVSAKKIILYRDSAGLESKFPQLKEFYNWMEGYQGDKIVIDYPEDDPDEPEKEKGVGKKRKPKGYYAANPKDYDIPDKKMTRYFSIDNDRLLTFLKKQMPDFMNKHYKANMGMFMMNDKDYQQFRKFLQSPKIVDNYGTTSINVDKERSFTESISSNMKYEVDSATKYSDGKVAVRLMKYDHDGNLIGSKFGQVVTGSRPYVEKRLRNEFNISPMNVHYKPISEDNEEKEQKTPISEFILSYFDRNTGQFPKGETAVLTMIEKDYGEEFIEPAKAFIERINERVSEVMGYKEPDIQEDDFDEGYKELPPIDREKYQERSGLEGPFSTLSGKVVYYDPKEGSYYDPDTDMYISYDDFKELDKDYSNMKDDIEFDRVRKLAGL